MNSAIFLMGPTACGKTEAACALAERFDCEIVSVDSAMVYRGLNIGAAKPSPAILARYPHHLIDICAPTERYSAAQFRDDALATIAAITARGKTPLLVGGTGLYFRVLSEGIAELPSIDAAIREQLAQELAREGVHELHQRLGRVDAQSAARIHPNDTQRILRALEVYRQCGVSMSRLWEAQAQTQLPFEAIQFVLAPVQRKWLHKRIEQRFHAMLAAGFINEVRALRERGDLSLDDNAMRAVGYRAVWRYLDGELTAEQMIERGIAATRQLAKRQFTWFRGIANAQWFDASMTAVIDEMSVAIKRRIKVD